MWEKIAEYFTFSRQERRGILVLLIVIISLFIVPYWIRRPPGSEDPAATGQFAPLIEKLSGEEAEQQAGSPGPPVRSFAKAESGNITRVTGQAKW